MLLVQQGKYALLVEFKFSHPRLALLVTIHPQLPLTLVPYAQLVLTAQLKQQLCLAQLAKCLT